MKKCLTKRPCAGFFCVNTAEYHGFYFIINLDANRRYKRKNDVENDIEC